MLTYCLTVALLMFTLKNGIFILQMFLRKKVYLFFFFSFCILIQSICYAQQNRKIDSLEKAFAIAKEDTSKIKLLNEISLELSYNNEFEKAIQYAVEGKTFAERTIAFSAKPIDLPGLRKSMAEVLNTLGVLYMNQGEYSKALSSFYRAITIYEFYHNELKKGFVYNSIGYTYAKQGKLHDAFAILRKAIGIHEKYNNKEGLGIAYNNLGLTYWNQSDFPNALNCFLKALKLFEEIGNKTRLAKCYNNIGNISVNQGNFDEALKYYFESLKLAQEAENKIDIGYVYNNIGMVYVQQDKTKEALNYFQKSLVLCELIGDKEGIGTAYLNIGSIYQQQGQFEKANHNYDKSLSIYNSIGDNAGATYACLASGDIALIRNNLPQALAYFNQALVLSKEAGNRDEEKNIYQRLTNVYVQQGNYKKAYEFQDLYLNINDSLFNTEKSRLMAEMSAKYETDKKQKAIELLNKDKELKGSILEKKEADIQKQRILRNALIFSLCLVIILLVLIFRSSASKQKANNLLEEKNASITHQNEIIEEKNKELEKLSIVAREAANAIFITDSKGELEWFNEGYSKLFGWKTLEEYRKLRGTNIFNVSANKNIKQIIDDCISRRTSVEYENATPTSNGNEIWIKTTLTPVFDNNGNLKQMVFVETDVSELKKANEFAQQSLQIQEQFLANTSHEIRTPMNGVLGMTRQLLETPLSPEQTEYVNAIKESSNNLLHVVNDILDISKIKAGKISFEKNEFKINDLFKSLYFMLQYKAEEKNISIDSSVDTNIPPVLIGDAFRLNQILINLASNAIKFTEVGTVKFTAELLMSEDNHSLVRFCVIDTGIGIPEDKLDYIFETFAQAETHTTRKYGGTGLGLSISKVLVEELGGKITVISKVDVGSSFSFELKFGHGDPAWDGPITKYTEDIPATVNLSKVNVLMVEDNVINQRVALFELNKWKAKTDVANNASIAFEKLKNKQYDLILMDISMPGMDGIEATQYIRHNFPEPVNQIPIIAMTASALQGEKERCLNGGMNDYISKPFNPVTLYKKIIHWCTDEKTQGIEDESPVETPLRKTKRLIDLSLILDHASGDIEYVKEVIRIYIETMPEYLTELKNYYKQEKWEDLEKQAHKMKSPVAYLGVTELKDALEKMERMGTQNMNVFSLKDLMKIAIELTEASVFELMKELNRIS